LERDRADLGPHGLRDAVRRDVGLARDCPQDGQPLRRDLNAALSKQACEVVRHGE
jgi:hypothetical protein